MRLLWIFALAVAPAVAAGQDRTAPQLASVPMDRVYVVGVDGVNSVFYCDITLSNLSGLGDGVFYADHCKLISTNTLVEPIASNFPLFISMQGKGIQEINRQCNFYAQQYSTIARSSTVLDCRQ